MVNVPLLLISVADVVVVGGVKAELCMAGVGGLFDEGSGTSSISITIVLPHVGHEVLVLSKKNKYIQKITTYKNNTLKLQKNLENLRKSFTKYTNITPLL